MLAVQALRPSLVHETGAVAADRILAVLGRLGAAPSFTRPPLPAGSAGGRSVTLSVAPAVAPPAPEPPASEQVAPVAAPAGEVVQPADEHAEDPGHQVDGSAPTADRPDETRPVLPVPAPRNASPTSRSRRRLRRTVDA